MDYAGTGKSNTSKGIISCMLLLKKGKTTKQCPSPNCMNTTAISTFDHIKTP
jgi:hypothetical protein